MRLPQHLAIIMDGNGRWAEQRNKPRHYGHIKGTQVAKSIIQDCARLGVKHLTLYAFSTENWYRPLAEVSILMKLLKKYLEKETATLVKENIRFNVIGDTQKLSKDIQEIINNTTEKTKHCRGMRLTFALSYGSRQELTQAMKALAAEVQSGTIDAEDINEDLIAAKLQTFGTPDPDLILRTSGEQRISNFLLWQSAYSEFFFSPKLWPEFSHADLLEVLQNFNQRERRFGRVEAVQVDEQLSN